MIKCSCMLYNLKDKITIVIPCYNDADNIENLLEDISNQYYAKGIKVKVVDYTFSNKIKRKTLLKKKELSLLNIDIIPGMRDWSRNREVPFLFFIDPNIRLESKWTLFNYVVSIKSKSKKYLACRLTKKYTSRLSQFIDNIFPSKSNFYTYRQSVK